jgi:uncharacterized protein YndB with AHSA1/START domain
VDDDVKAPVALEAVAEIRIDAPVDQVWRSLTEDIGSWWPHSFSGDPKISIEPWIGGRFYEEFGDTGGGALYAFVTYVEPGATLTVSGPMGMRGARQYVKTYELEAEGSATRVRTVASMLGDMPPELRDRYREGGVEVLESLKRQVERSP